MNITNELLLTLTVSHWSLTSVILLTLLWSCLCVTSLDGHIHWNLVYTFFVNRQMCSHFAMLFVNPKLNFYFFEVMYCSQLYSVQVLPVGRIFWFQVLTRYYNSEYTYMFLFQLHCSTSLFLKSKDTVASSCCIFNWSTYPCILTSWCASVHYLPFLPWENVWFRCMITPCF